MARYRKKPVEIEALQFTGSNSGQVAQFITDGGGTFRAETHPTDGAQDVFYIRTLEGEMRAVDGDWIIKGVAGEFYPCRDDIFAATYEPVTPCQVSSSAPNALGNERCKLPAGHTGRHADGNLTWPASEVTEEEKTARVLSGLYRSAEENVTRVIGLYERWVKAGPPPLGTSMSRWWDARLVELRDAINPDA